MAPNFYETFVGKSKVCELPKEFVKTFSVQRFCVSFPNASITDPVAVF